MRIEEDRRAALTLGANDIAHQPAAHGIEPRSRLVEEDQLRLMNQGLRQPDALQHAFGEVLQALVAVRRESHQVEKSRNALAQPVCRHAREASVQLEQFSRRQPFVETEIFRKEADSPPHVHIAGRHAQDKGLAAGRLDQSQ